MLASSGGRSAPTWLCCGTPRLVLLGALRSWATPGTVVYSYGSRRCSMDRAPGLLLLLVLTLAPIATWPQDLPSPPKAGGKVCVATVSNVSSRSALVERLTERLSNSLKDNKISALAMDS